MCGQQVYVWEDAMFDKCYFEFTTIDQSIPLSHKMLAFKDIERDYASIFMTSHEYETVTVPDFTRERVSPLKCTIRN